MPMVPVMTRERAAGTDQPRRATAGRPASRRRAAGRRPVPWLTPLLTVAAGALVVGSQVTPVLVEVTAATAPTTPTATTRVTAPRVATPLRGSTPLPPAPVPVAATGGLAVPQPPRPREIVVVPNAAVGHPPVYEQRPDPCGGGGTTPRRIVPGVVPGPGAATLDWMADDRPEVLGYRVQAVSQRVVGGRQPAPVVQDVAQRDGCVGVTVTITGLTPGDPYVFWLEEQVTSASTGVTRLVQVGTTGAVVIG